MTCTWIDLRELMEECAGKVDGRNEFRVDKPFSQLDYDSLAILETLSALERRYHLQLPDIEAGDIRTPQDFLDLVNYHLSRAA